MASNSQPWNSQHSSERREPISWRQEAFPPSGGEGNEEASSLSSSKQRSGSPYQPRQQIQPVAFRGETNHLCAVWTQLLVGKCLPFLLWCMYCVNQQKRRSTGSAVGRKTPPCRCPVNTMERALRPLEVHQPTMTH